MNKSEMALAGSDKEDRQLHGSHFLPIGAENLRFSRYPPKFVSKKSFQSNREPTNST